MADEKEHKSELDLDLDAFSERQAGSGRHIKFAGNRYPIKSVYDLGVEQVLQLMGLNKRLQEAPYPQQLEEMRDAVAMLAPSMPPDALNRLTGRMMSHVLRNVFSPEAEDRPTEGGETTA